MADVVAVSKDSIQTQNPSSARFGNPGEMVVQRMRFKLVNPGDTAVVYKTGGFNVGMDEMGVVETAHAQLEGDLEEDLGDLQAIVKAIQVDTDAEEAKNNVVVQLREVSTGEELANDAPLDGLYCTIEAEGY